MQNAFLADVGVEDIIKDTYLPEISTTAFSRYERYSSTVIPHMEDEDRALLFNVSSL